MISNLERSAGDSHGPIYQIKVTLLGTKPPIWRRLHVPSNANLAWFHAVLQVTVGWTNSHLHHFITSDSRYSDLQDNDEIDFGEKPNREEAKASISSVLPQKGARIIYEYDFGDSWRHEVKLEKILAREGMAEENFAVCMAGARSCPPEDCGGIWGYANLLEALKDRKHPEHREMLEWLGRPIDPEFLDLNHTNKWLRKLAWPRVTESRLRKVLMGRDHFREE